MRTKTLLMAVAALAAGITISNAQVYSANVVGYAAVATPHSGTYYMMAVPFAIGASNGANEVFTTPLPDFSQVLTWDVGSQSYVTYQAASFSSTGWTDPSFAEVPAPELPVGQAFFLNLSADGVTNVFSGAIAVNVGTSNKMVLANSGTYYAIGCVVPYSGSVSNGTASGGGANLNGLPDFSLVLTWDADSQSYVTVQAASFSSTGWADPSFAEVPPPTLGVGQGFLINLSDTYTWTTGL